MWRCVRALALCVVFYTTFVDAKLMSGLATLNSMDTEMYIAKFAFSSGYVGSIEGDFNVSSTYLANRPAWLKFGPNLDFRSLQVALYNEEAWARYRKAVVEGSLCTDRLTMAVYRTKVPMHDLAEGDYEDIKFNLAEKIESKTNSHYWYGIVADCSLEEYDAHPPTLQYALTFKNGGSHLPADEDGLLISHIFVMLLMGGFLCMVAYGIHLQLNTTKQVHLCVLLLGAAEVLQICSVFCEIWHLWRYSNDGLGLRWRYSYLPLDFLSEVYQGLSELIIQVVLISLAFGWTIIPTAADTSGFFKGLAKPYEFFEKASKASFFVIGLSVTQFSLELAGRAYEDDFSQFHDHEHWPGYVLMLMRFSLAGLFAYGVRSTKQQALKTSEEEISKFFLKLQLTGCAWFLAFPVTVVLASVAAPYRRHGIVTIGAIVTQVGALAYLQFMFLTRSDYYKISTLRNMGTMMGGGTVRAGKVCVD